MSPSGRALVVGHPESREALAGCRGLGMAGWVVGVGSAQPADLCRASTFTERWHRIPPPDGGLEPFLTAVAAAVTAGGYDIVFAAGDPEVIALSVGRDQLDTCVPYAPHAVVRRSIDKWSLHRAAVEVGVSVPHTVRASEEAVAGWRGPAIVKPRLHWHPRVGPAPAWIAARRVEGPRALTAAINRIAMTGREAILQRPITGGLVSMTALRTRSGVVSGLLQQRARRTYPRDMGVSAHAETIDLDDRLAEHVVALLDHLGWVGMAQLQFVSVSAGASPTSHRLIDFNGRFYGSLGLALRAGTNFPAAWADAETGRGEAPLQLPRTGVRQVWLEGDLRQAMTAPVGERAAALRRVVAELPGAGHSICSTTDPGPMLLAPLVRLSGTMASVGASAGRRLLRAQRSLVGSR